MKTPAWQYIEEINTVLCMACGKRLLDDLEWYSHVYECPRLPAAWEIE